MNSKDYELGKIIQQILIKHDLENPVVNEQIANWDDPGYLDQLGAKFADFLHELGINLSDQSVIKTPSRVVDLFINEAFYGLNYKNFPKISSTSNTYKYKTPLISSGIKINSTCEHHLVSINGSAHIAYIPKDKIVGLSKINRVVDFFARRPQVQERMTRQIFVALKHILETDDVAIAIKATHHCIVMRGIKDTKTENLTLEFGGQFLLNESAKSIFYNSVYCIK